MLSKDRIVKPTAFTYGDARLDRYYKTCKNAAAQTKQLYALSKVPGMDEATLIEIRKESIVLIEKLEDWRLKVFKRRKECERMGVVVEMDDVDLEMWME